MSPLYGHLLSLQNYRIDKTQHYALQLAAHLTLLFNISMMKQTYYHYTHTLETYSVYIFRPIFDRLIGSSLNAKKMKVIFKKYLDFETKYGNEESIMNVKQKAIKYVRQNV